MTYKYMNLIPISTTPGSAILSEFQAFVNEQFEVAPDYYAILEESVLGSGSYVLTDVRINTAISQETGAKLGDDFKKVMFKDLAHAASIGIKYFFDDNYFITVNTEILKNFAASSTIRRCNNMLRWIDSDGTYYEEPCAIEYEISRPRDLMGTENIPLPQGYVTVYAQLNQRTRKIKGNQRFLFGPPENRVCFRVFGEGVRNFLNQDTLNDTSATLLQLTMGGNFVNPDVDNLELGIADYYKDYSNLTSGSNVGTYSIQVSPNVNYVLESGSSLFDVRYYSGSVVQSGSFIFSVADANVPVANYVFAQETPNKFSVFNIAKYPNAPLNILCSGSSGSRILPIELRGVW